MGKLAEAYVDVGANLKPLEAGLARARTSLASFAGKGVAVGIGALGAAGGAAGIGGGLLAAAKKGADLGESISKVKVVFGSAAKGMTDQADALASKFGAVKREVLDAAAGFGLMGRAAGLSQGASAKLGQEMVQLGLDMASFHNISNEDAFQKLRSGLAGESEPLRPLGILLSEDAVKAEALAMGLVKVKRELTDQEKVLARLSLIKKQAGPAAGDLDRTKDSAANQLRRLQGDAENAAVSFGEKLIPALTSAIALARELGGAFEKAFGTGPVDAFAERLKTTADAWRVTAGAGGGGTTLLDLGNRAADLVGLGDTDAVKAAKRVATERAAAQLGLPLEAAGNGWGVGNNGFGRAAQQAGQDAAMKARDVRDQARADEKLEQRKADRIKGMGIQGDEVERAGRGLATNFMAQLRNVAGAFAPGAAGQGAINAIGRNLIPGIGLGKAGGGLLQGALALGNRAMGAARDQVERGPFQSQQFSSGGDFAKFAIQQALSDPADTAKKQLEQLEQAAGKLDEIKGIAQGFLEQVARAPALRAILRGAS